MTKTNEHLKKQILLLVNTKSMFVNHTTCKMQCLCTSAVLNCHDAVRVTMNVDHHVSDKHSARTAPTCHSVNIKYHHSANIARPSLYHHLLSMHPAVMEVLCN